jgi:glycine/D-amino acid oxidase-like deaminating enzyme
LGGAITADVIIIGAGFTGLSAALHLAQSGANVVVVEAMEPGWGASGRNNGQVIPTLSRPDPDDIIARHGDAGERFVHLIRDSASGLFDLARTEQIDAEAEQTGWLQPAHTPGRMRIAERRVAQWTRHGAPARLLSRDDMNRVLGSNAWHGGWTNPTGGHINPLALVRGLVRSCLAKGVRIFVRSPVVTYGRIGRHWIATTETGRAVGSSLIVATNAYTGELSKRLAPDIAREVVPVLSWQMATAPISDTVRQSILPQRSAMSDTRGELFFMRYDARHRLVTGGALVAAAKGAERLKPYIAKRLTAMFPDIGDVSFDFVWNGYVGMTRDFLPRFHQIGPGGFAWAGCNGRAVGLSIAIGREFAKAVAGARLEDIALPFTNPEPLALHRIVRTAAPLKLLDYKRLDRREV